MRLKDKILTEAKKSPTVKKALKKLFPNVFLRIRKNNGGVDLSKLSLDRCNIFENPEIAGCHNGFIQIRTGGKYKNKAFYLSDLYNWEITKDSQNSKCLIFNEKNPFA